MQLVSQECLLHAKYWAPARETGTQGSAPTAKAPLTPPWATPTHPISTAGVFSAMMQGLQSLSPSGELHPSPVTSPPAGRNQNTANQEGKKAQETNSTLLHLWVLKLGA